MLCSESHFIVNLIDSIFSTFHRRHQRCHVFIKIKSVEIPTKLILLDLYERLASGNARHPPPINQTLYDFKRLNWLRRMAVTLTHKALNRIV